MAISIQQLKVFVATAKTTQVSQAAQRCYITQAAASMAISQFEGLMRAQVFERIGRRLVLNDVGKQLLPKAEEILQRIDEFEMLGRSDELTGTLSIGASKTTGTYFLPPLLTKFLTKFPTVTLDYDIDNSDSVIEQVLQGDVDVGFIESDYSSPKLTVHTVKDDELLIIADKHHPLAKKSTITPDDLKNYPWILREKGSGTRRIFEMHTHKFFNKLDITIELNEPEAIKKMLPHSKALTCLSEEIVQEELQKKQLVALHTDGLALKRKFNMITLSDRYQTALLKEFNSFMLDDSAK